MDCTVMTLWKRPLPSPFSVRLGTCCFPSVSASHFSCTIFPLEALPNRDDHWWALHALQSLPWHDMNAAAENGPARQTMTLQAAVARRANWQKDPLAVHGVTDRNCPLCVWPSPDFPTWPVQGWMVFRDVYNLEFQTRSSLFPWLKFSKNWSIWWMP